MRRGAHYVLATIPVLAALGLAAAFGGSVTSYVFSLAVLAVGLRFTEERPNATLKIVQSVARQLRSGFRASRLRPDARPADPPAGSHGAQPDATQ
jgi:hypothetical protein